MSLPSVPLGTGLPNRLPPGFGASVPEERRWVVGCTKIPRLPEADSG
jgi:hypothetical protein